MIFSNDKPVNVLRTACFCLLLSVPFFYFLKVRKSITIEDFCIYSVMSLIVLVYIYARANYFKYDSSGEKLRFQNRKALYRFYLKRKMIEVELDKTKLKRYKVINVILYKYLMLYSDEKTYQKLTFDITFLTPRKTKLLKMSLDRVLNSNTATA